MRLLRPPPKPRTLYETCKAMSRIKTRKTATKRTKKKKTFLSHFHVDIHTRRFTGFWGLWVWVNI